MSFEEEIVQVKNQNGSEGYAIRRRSLRHSKQANYGSDEPSKEDDFEEEEEEEYVESTMKISSIHKRVNTRQTRRRVKELHFDYDLEYIRKLATTYPDHYGQHSFESDNIEFINKHNPLRLQTTLTQSGAIYGLAFSPCGSVLASCSNLGYIKLWDVTTWAQIGELRDTEEKNIEEFYVMQWSDDGRSLIAAGKLKSRERWSEEDDDNYVSVFDVITGTVIHWLEGHEEEIYCMKKVRFKDENYLLTCSEDGRIIKWHMSQDFRELIEWNHIDDLTTYMAISLSFIPNTGNKYFLCGGDDCIKIFDFEAEQLVITWKGVYSYLCDCIKVVECSELEIETPRECYILSKGVELLDEDNEMKVLHPNKCILHKLVMPTSPNAYWKLLEVARFTHDNYNSNLWFLHLTSNGRYILGPTTTGKIFIWNIKSKQLVAVLKDHTAEVRDMIFHPTKRILVTCGEDSAIQVYTQDTTYQVEEITEVECKERQDRMEQREKQDVEEEAKRPQESKRKRDKLKPIVINKEEEAEEEYDLVVNEEELVDIEHCL